LAHSIRHNGDLVKFIGVDGCKRGWFFVGLDDNNSWNIGILSKISELSELITASDLILVDIPIGLWEDNKNERQCDLEARKVLKQRRSSVFPVPSRLALNCKTYEEGSQVNYEYTARKLSRQSWAIASKIKEMDKFLGEIETPEKIREFHPEVGFWGLNNYVAMQYSKKSQEGFNERLALLSNYCWYAKDIVEMAKRKYHRKEVAKDDIIDALVAAVTAKFHPSLGTLPQEPERDSKGWSMEIVYAKL
jgi:predicted RNase H-like nuclease